MTSSWSELAAGPSPRADPAIVWDDSSSGLLSFGGFNTSYLDDLWRFAATPARPRLVAKCPVGQTCVLNTSLPNLPSILSVKRSCMDSESLASAESSDGTFAFTEGAGSSISSRLHVDPGLYTLCSCDASQCSPSDLVALGFFISEGPFANQRLQCVMGQPCAFASLRGVGLSVDDRVIAMRQCGTDNASATFGHASASPQTSLRIDRSMDAFTLDLGQLEPNGVPETLNLCWCPAGRCGAAEDFRATALELQILCPPGLYEVDGSCESCPEGYFCPDGQRVDSCPAWSSSPAGSSHLLRLSDCI